jgi:phosphonate transport system substrate-binding protein
MKRTLLTLALLALAACRPAAAETPTPAEPAAQQAIVIGEITDDPAEVILGAQPLADYLAERLADYGVTGGEVRVVQTPEEMADLLASGEVDIFFDSIFPATVIADQSGAQIVLRRWKFGVEAYQSVIFAHADSGITRLEHLPGHILVMDTPYSTSGFLMPAVTLTSLGLPLVGKDSANAAVAPDEIGFVFSFSDPATLNWVLTGIAPAGVTDDYNFDVALPEEAAGKLVELARTEKIPRQVMPDPQRRPAGCHRPNPAGDGRRPRSRSRPRCFPDDEV